MYRKLPESTGRALGYTFSGNLTVDEIKAVHRDVEAAVAQHGEVRLLTQFVDLGVPEVRAVWEDLKLTPTYVSKVTRFALVGDEPWHAWAARATDILTRGEARYFEPSELDDAWAWVKA